MTNKIYNVVNNFINIVGSRPLLLRDLQQTVPINKFYYAFSLVSLY